MFAGRLEPGRGSGEECVTVGRSCCSSDNSKIVPKRGADSYAYANRFTCGKPAPPRDCSAEGKYAPFDGIENTRHRRNIANIFRQFRARPQTPSARRSYKLFEDGS